MDGGIKYFPKYVPSNLRRMMCALRRHGGHIHFGKSMFGLTLAGMQSILIGLIFNCVIASSFSDKSKFTWEEPEELPFRLYKNGRL